MTLRRADKLVTVASGYSHAGLQRAVNEDHLATPEGVDPELLARLGHLYVVADGVGGHAAGEQASALAVSTVMEAYYGHPSPEPGQALTEAIRQANATLHRQAQHPGTAGMTSTVVAALVRGRDLYIAHVGESRAYLIRGQTIKQITRDHSWVAEQVTAGLLSEEEARHHPQRNIVTRYLGSGPDVEIDVCHERLRPGDAVLLCSDGLTGQVLDEEIRQIVTGNDPQEAANQLVELANERGGSDDITALVVGMMQVPQPVSAGLLKSSRFAPIAGGVAIAMVFLVALYWVLALRRPMVPSEIVSLSPTFVVMVSTQTPVPSVPAATLSVTPLPEVPTPTPAAIPELATPTIKPPPMIPPTATPTPVPTPTRPEPQSFHTEAQEGHIRYVTEDGDWAMKIARQFGASSNDESWERAREIRLKHPDAFGFGRIDGLLPGRSIILQPSNFGYVIAGRVEDFPRQDFTAGFDLILEPSKGYRISFLDPKSVLGQPNPLTNGDIVRVFGYLEGEVLLKAVLVDRYLQEEEGWQNWCVASEKEGEYIWVYGKLNEWGFGGVEGVKRLMESNYGEAVAAYGFWQRPCPTCDIIAFQMDEVYFWSEAEKLYTR